MASVLQPLNDFLGVHGAAVADAALWSGGGGAGGFAARVLELVAERFKGLVLELLATVRQMDDALKKLKKAKGAAGKDGLSDADKARRGELAHASCRAKHDRFVYRQKMFWADVWLHGSHRWPLGSQIGLQLFLDAGFFGAELKMFGCDEGGALVELQSLVEPYRQCIG